MRRTARWRRVGWFSTAAAATCSSSTAMASSAPPATACVPRRCPRPPSAPATAARRGDTSRRCGRAPTVGVAGLTTGCATRALTLRRRCCMRGWWMCTTRGVRLDEDGIASTLHRTFLFFIHHTADDNSVSTRNGTAAALVQARRTRPHQRTSLRPCWPVGGLFWFWNVPNHLETVSFYSLSFPRLSPATERTMSDRSDEVGPPKRGCTICQPASHREDCAKSHRRLRKGSAVGGAIFQECMRK